MTTLLIFKAMFESILQDITFPLSYVKTQLHLAHLKQYPEANCPEYNEVSANLQHCQQQCVAAASLIDSMVFMVL